MKSCSLLDLHASFHTMALTRERNVKDISFIKDISTLKFNPQSAVISTRINTCFVSSN